jgi:hypothetical protein
VHSNYQKIDVSEGRSVICDLCLKICAAGVDDPLDVDTCSRLSVCTVRCESFVALLSDDWPVSVCFIVIRGGGSHLAC